MTVPPGVVYATLTWVFALSGLVGSISWIGACAFSFSDPERAERWARVSRMAYAIFWPVIIAKLFLEAAAQDRSSSFATTLTVAVVAGAIWTALRGRSDGEGELDGNQ